MLNQNTNYDYVDFLRGSAALMVVAFHTYIWIIAPLAPGLFENNSIAYIYTLPILDAVSHVALSAAFMGVNLFFVVSGFCIHLPAARRQSNSINPTEFFARRLLRLYPLYILVVASLFILFGPVLGRYEQHGVSVENFVGHIFFWHYLGPEKAAGMGISAVLWTLAIEVQFYIMYIILFRLIKRVGFGRAAIVFILLEVFYRVAFNVYSLSDFAHMYFAPSRFPPMRFGEWLLGAWVAERIALGSLPRRVPCILIVSGLFSVATSFYVGIMLGISKYDATDVQLAVSFTLIIYGLVELEKRSMVVHNSFTRMMLWLGAISYSLYIVHPTVVFSVRELQNRTGDAVRAPAVAGTAAILLSIAVAFASYRLIERPSHRLSREAGGYFRRRRSIVHECPTRVPR